MYVFGIAQNFTDLLHNKTFTTTDSHFLLKHVKAFFYD